jgi:uncharacterized protein (DUF1778 family)
MIRLNLSPERQAALEKCAAAAGTDIDTFVWEAIQDRLDEPTLAAAPYEVWKREYDAFKATLKPRNPNFDDSRESMYD